MSDATPIHVGSYGCAEHRIVEFAPEPQRKSGLVRTVKRQVFLPDPDQPEAPEPLAELGPAELLAASEDGAVEATAFGRVVQWRTRQPDRRQQVVLPEAVGAIAFDGLTERIVALSGDGLWAIDPNTGTYRQAAELPWLGILKRLRHPWNHINLTEQAGTYVFGNGRERCAVVRGTVVENVVLPHRCLCAWGTAEGAVGFLCAKDSKLLALASPSTELWRADLPAPVVVGTACPGGAAIAGILKDGAAFLGGQDGKTTWFPRQGPVEGIALTRRGLEAQLLVDNAVHRFFLGTAHKKIAQGVDHRGKNIQGTIAACREELDATMASLAAQKSRILTLHDAARHGRTVVDKEMEKTGKELEQLTKQTSESPDAMERAEAAAILPLINDQVQHFQLQRVYSDANIQAAEGDLRALTYYATAARCMDQRLAVLSTQLGVDELRAKCRAEAVVHIDPHFAQICGAIHQASVQRMQELIALSASGDGRGLLPQHERTEEEKKLLSIEAGRETTSKARGALDHMVAAAEASLEASLKELAEREGILQETSERLQIANATLASLKARQDEMLGQVAAAEGKTAVRGKDLESLRKELREQEEAAGRLDRAVREENEKIELERKRAQKLGATLRDLGPKS